jgi:hypothetical protein
MRIDALWLVEQRPTLCSACRYGCRAATKFSHMPSSGCHALRERMQPAQVRDQPHVAPHRYCDPRLRCFILTCGYIDADSDDSWYAMSIILSREEGTASSFALVGANGTTLCAAIYSLPGCPLPGLRQHDEHTNVHLGRSSVHEIRMHLF